MSTFSSGLIADAKKHLPERLRRSLHAIPIKALLFAVCGLVFLPIDALSNDSAPYIVLSKGEMPLEQKLALVNANKGALPSNDITIARFRYLLDKAVAKTGDTEKEIADTACKGQGLVRENGKNITLLEFMEAVNKLLFSPGVPKMKYHDAALMTAMSLSE